MFNKILNFGFGYWDLSFDKLRPFEALRSPQALEEMVSGVEPFRN